MKNRTAEIETLLGHRHPVRGHAKRLDDQPRREVRVRYVALAGGKGEMTPQQEEAHAFLKKHGKTGATRTELARHLRTGDDVAYSIAARLRKQGRLKTERKKAAH